MPRLHRWLTVLVLSAVGGAASPGIAAACSCARSTSPCEAFAAARVFVGEVMSVQDIDGEWVHRMRVLRTVKGAQAVTADVWSDAGSSCGRKLTEGHRYVIYTSATGRIEVHGCSPIVHIPPGEPEPELPPIPGRIYGHVVRYGQDPSTSSGTHDPVASVRLWLDLPAGRATAISDAWGRFTFADVPPGTHAIGVDAGQSLRPWFGDSATVTSGACADTRVVLHPSGGIAGRVLTVDGKPAAAVDVALYDADGSDDPTEVLFEAATEPDGTFSIDGLSPGEYLLAVNPLGDVQAGQPYPASFFGGADRESATRISVGDGEAVELDQPFVLKPALATRVFTVVVTCRDAATPIHAFASAQSMTPPGMVEHDVDLSEDEPDTRPRTRTLTLLRDQAYTLQVTAWIRFGPPGSNGRDRRSEALAPVEIPAGAPGRHLALVAPFTNCGDGGR